MSEAHTVADPCTAFVVGQAPPGDKHAWAEQQLESGRSTKYACMQQAAILNSAEAAAAAAVQQQPWRSDGAGGGGQKLNACKFSYFFSSISLNT